MTVKIDDGGAPWDAIASIATLLTVLVAVGVALAEFARAQRAARSAEKASREQAASSVLAWGSQMQGARKRWDLTVYNGSGGPIFDVHVVLPDLTTVRLDVVMPHTPQREMETFDSLATRAGHTKYLPVRFTDARGITWRRPAPDVDPGVPAVAEMLTTKRRPSLRARISSTVRRVIGD